VVCIWSWSQTAFCDLIAYCTSHSAATCWRLSQHIRVSAASDIKCLVGRDTSGCVSTMILGSGSQTESTFPFPILSTWPVNSWQGRCQAESEGLGHIICISFWIVEISLDSQFIFFHLYIKSLNYIITWHLRHTTFWTVCGGVKWCVNGTCGEYMLNLGLWNKYSQTW
jgi:hypothetical protein